MNIADLVEQLADLLIEYIESRNDFCEKDSILIDEIYNIEAKLHDYKKLEQKESR